jgi:hypothetical protein
MNNLLSLDINVRLAAALVTLGSDNLVVVLAKLHAGVSPGVEVVLHVDATTDTLLGADRPVLVEGPGTVNGGLVVTGGLVEVVSATVGVDSALVGGSAAGVVGAEGLDNVVLDERVAGPAVDGEVTVTLEVDVATVVDDTK